MLKGLVEKNIESLQILPLAFRYKQERSQALEAWKKEHPGEDIKTSGLESRLPFEYPSFLSAIVHIAKRVGPKIVEYHLISDERSARIPTLVFASWQRRVRDAYPDAPRPEPGTPTIDFILGGTGGSTARLQEFLQKNQERFRNQPNLWITEYLDTGDGLSRILPAFEKFKIPLDLAVLSHYSPLSEYRDLFQGRNVYQGEILPSSLLDTWSMAAGSTVVHRTRLTGMGEDNKNPKHHPILLDDQWRRPAAERLVRQQASDFAQNLPIPKR